MRTPIRVALVTLSLVLGLTILILINNLTPFNSSNNSTYTTPQSTNTPTNQPTYNNKDITFNYSVSKQDPDVFYVTIEYKGKNSIAINYSQFYLHLSASRELTGFQNETRPQNNGLITLGLSNSKVVIQLIFHFERSVFNGSGYEPVKYDLEFSYP